MKTITKIEKTKTRKARNVVLSEYAFREGRKLAEREGFANISAMIEQMLRKDLKMKGEDSEEDGQKNGSLATLQPTKKREA